MKAAFNLVRGAVSKKDLVPVLTHFAIHQGRIYGYNGRILISAPCKELKDFASCTVPAALLLAAIDACTGNPVLATAANQDGVPRVTVTDAGSDFKAVLPAGDIANFPVPVPPAKAKKIKDPLLPVLRLLQPFIGEDASRLWCASIKFQGAVAIATNNVALAVAGLPQGMPLTTCALPVFAVEELLRMGLEPTGIVFEGDDKHALWFLLPGQVWVRTSLVADQWPDAMAILRATHQGATMRPVDPNLAKAVAQCVPFCPDRHVPAIVFDGDQVRTQDGASTARVGGFDALAHGTYHATPLQLVLAVATAADWTKAPRVPWDGADGLQGVLVGLAGQNPPQSAP